MERVYTERPGFDHWDIQWNATYTTDRRWEILEYLASWPADAPTPPGYEIVEGPPPGPFDIGYECLVRMITYAGPQWEIARCRVAANAPGYGPMGRIAGGQRVF
jgi:hypothetical protein